MNDTDIPEDVLLQTVRQLGYEVIHTHDNLVFVSGNQFILKQSDSSPMIDLYFNEELEESVAEGLSSRIEATGLENSLLITYKGAYCVIENDDQSVSVEFFDLAAE